MRANTIFRWRTNLPTWLGLTDRTKITHLESDWTAGGMAYYKQSSPKRPVSPCTKLWASDSGMLLLDISRPEIHRPGTMQKISSSLVPCWCRRRDLGKLFNFPEFAQLPKFLVPSMTLTLLSEGLLVSLRVFPVITLNPNLEGLEFFLFFVGDDLTSM